MYRVWIEDVLGLRVEADKLRIDPCISSSWDGFTVRYDRGTALYEIEVTNPERVEQGVVSVQMDGKSMLDGIVPLSPDHPGKESAVTHKVKVVMGKARDQ
jgi:cyclic beta-1,2-glucan synthetase